MINTKVTLAGVELKNPVMTAFRVRLVPVQNIVNL